MKLSKEIKAGLIAVLAIVSFVVLFQFMKGKSLFSSDNVFYTQIDDVAGLATSSPVSINGLKVGQVDEIKPITKKDGTMGFVVKLLVNKDFIFSKQSTVQIFEPGMMSGKEMKISLIYGGEVAQSGDTLKGSNELSMMASLTSQVGPVKDQLQNALKGVDSLANSANKILDEKNRAEIRALLINLNRTVAGFEATSKQVNALLTNNDPKLQKLLESADKTMATANDAVGKYGQIAQDLDTKKLNQTVADLDASIVKLNSVISGIQNGEGSLGKLAKDEQLYQNLNQASANLNNLLIDLKANPKRYINISVFGKNNKN
ncbi:MAG: MCE family protein [Bacteroidetes bacterium]|nr:MCE family protein [Bacteroidota bacterium]